MVIVHEIIPGKLAEFKRWYKQVDQERKAKNPDYVPPKRYVTVIGKLTRVIIEWEQETMFEHSPVWLETVETYGNLKAVVFPGGIEHCVLKELD
jgi:hypothetical protein